MTRRGRVFVLTLLAVGAACSTVSVSTDYDRAADFSLYRTFAVTPGHGFRNQLQRDRFERAAAAALAAKGLRRVEGRPDLRVVLHVRLDRETQIDTAHFGYGWGRWGYWGRPYGGGTVTTVRQVPVGTVVVDLVDAQASQLVWQAVASDIVDRRATPEERDRHVAEIMEKAFSSYPPKP